MFSVILHNTMMDFKVLYILCLLSRTILMQPLIMPKANINQDRTIESDRKQLWEPLLLIGGAVVGHMTSHSNEELQDDALAVMFEKSTVKEAQILVDVISSETPNVQCVYFCMDTQTLQKTFHNLNKTKARFGVVLVALNNETLMEDIFNHVMSHNAFHWTAVVHVTEWLIITSRRINRLTKSASPMPDFVTTISFSDGHRNSISVYQKSRTEGLVEVFSFNLRRLQFESYFNFRIRNQSQDYSSEFHEQLSKHDPDVSDIKRMPTVNPEIADEISSRVRKSGKSYLRSKRSILDGVHLKISLFVYPDGQDKMAEERKLDNRTVVGGFYVSMLQILQQGLGFTYEVILVNDSGYFGRVDSDGQATGVVGHLSRREAAFTIIPLSMSLDRLEVIDFVSVCPVSEYTKVIYRLPEPGATMDLSYVNIIQSDLVLIFLMGPLLTMALIGAFLHVLSRSCTLADPQSCSIEALKELYSYPDHFCFETQVYVSQSGRVLKATWGVFWLILSSAYSAYLTTTFAVKSKELQIDSLKSMVEVQGYDIGIHGGLSNFISTLHEDNPDPSVRQLARILQQLNSSNPMTFSDNATYHMERVLKGGYIFMTVGPLPGILEGDTKIPDPLLRSYLISEPISLVNTGVAKDVFFKDDLYKFMLRVQESSVGHKLKQDLFKSTKVARETLTNEEVPVRLKKIELLIYVVLFCLVVSASLLLIELMVEKLLHKYKHKFNKNQYLFK